MKNNKSISAVTTILLALILTTQILIPAFAAEEYQTLQVNYHTQSEIAEYIAEHGVSFAEAADAFDVEASSTVPYTPARLKQREVDNAVETLNAYRYIAGIDYNVCADQSRSETAADAALISALNNGISHTPVRPNGMSDSVYERCYAACKQSLLSASSFSSSAGLLPYSVAKHISYFISDFGTSNSQKLLHRRYLLSQQLCAVGIGAARTTTREAAAVAMLTGIIPESYDLVAWPAQNTPIDFFAAKKLTLWSLQINTTLTGPVTVKITNRNTANSWTLTSTETYDYNADCQYLWVERDTDKARPISTIVFRPGDAASIKAGDVYDIEVSGSEFKTIKYSVNFFSLPETLHVHTAETRVVDCLPTCSAEGTAHYICSSCGQTVTYTLPAQAHQDNTCDGICDNCGATAENRFHEYVVGINNTQTAATTTAQPEPQQPAAHNEPTTRPALVQNSAPSNQQAASSSDGGIFSLFQMFLDLIKTIVSWFKR